MRLEAFDGLKTFPYFHLMSFVSLRISVSRTHGDKGSIRNVPQIVGVLNKSQGDEVLGIFSTPISAAFNSQVKGHEGSVRPLSSASLEPWPNALFGQH
jgi:hypothetical protein